MSFSVLSIDEIPLSNSRASKTKPLREALSRLEIGEAIEVDFESPDGKTGYKQTTLAQVAASMSKAHPTIRFRIKRKQDQTGVYMLAVCKAEAAEQKPATPPRPNKKKVIEEAAA